MRHRCGSLYYYIIPLLKFQREISFRHSNQNSYICSSREHEHSSLSLHENAICFEDSHKNFKMWILKSIQHEKPGKDLKSEPNGNGQGPNDVENGQMSDHDFNEQMRQWIKTSSDSPRNWPTWRKWSIILGLNFFCTVIFIATTGFVTDQAEEQYGVGEVCVLLKNSIGNL